MSQNYNTSLFEMVEGELRIPHHKIAEILKNNPASVKKLVNTYGDELETIGKIIVSNSKILLTQEQLHCLFGVMRLHIDLSILLAKHGNSFKAIEEFSKKENIDTRKGFVYIVEFDNGNLKVGHSINPTQRLRNLETQSGNYIKRYSTLEFETKDKGLKAEKKLLRNLKKWRRIGEYIDKSYEHVVKTAKKTFKVLNYAEKTFLFTSTQLCEYIFKSQNFPEKIKNLISTKDKKPQPNNLNKLLEAEGLQIRNNQNWKVTEKGKIFKSKSYWKLDVLEELLIA
jgi:Mn-dependent DtxR family transcriptional regulator/predicted GIY-YIG superfamily endonuclease